ncbi:MAG: hypothetical protein HJJLKODD_01931 [Phycisphaerae bacterium]|nr:hypothetical protein [Phycisphaerae bacterium]
MARTLANPLEMRQVAESPLRVRATTGHDPSTRKQWNLPQPVAIIGSTRHADVVLHEEGVARAHVAIVNTGRHIVAVDLLSKTGTRCQQETIERRILKHGERLQLGTADIHLAITGTPDKTRADWPIDDPTVMPVSCVLVRLDTQQRYELSRGQVLIGSSPAAEIQVERKELALAHSLIFVSTRGVGICHLGSSMPLQLNGTQCRVGYLKDHDRISIGGTEFMFRLQSGERSPAVETPIPAATPTPEKSSMNTNTSTPGTMAPPRESMLDTATDLMADLPDLPTPPLGDNGEAATSMLTTLEQKMASLQQEIAQSWGQLSDWRKKLAVEKNQMHVHNQDLQNKEKLLEQMTHELDQRAQQLNQQTVQVQSQQQELQQRERVVQQRLAELEQREGTLGERSDQLNQLNQEIQQRQQEVEQFAAQYQQQREELNQMQQALQEQQATVEKDRRELEEMFSQLEHRAAEQQQRETQMGELETQALKQIEELQGAKQQLDQQVQAVGKREEQLRTYEQQLRAKWHQVREESLTIQKRQVIIERFAQFLQEANEAYQITISAPIDSTATAATAAPTSAADEQVADRESTATPDVAQERQQHIQALEQQARQMVEEMAEEPNEATTNGDSAVEHTGTIDWNAVEPEVRERLKVIKRLGQSRKSDAELIQQIREELLSSKDASSRNGKKKRWWG